MPTAMPAPEWVLWIAAVVLVLLIIRGAWRGYQRGPWRQLAGPLALLLGCATGWAFGAELGHSILHGTSFPWLLRGAAGQLCLSCLTCLLCYGLAWRLGKRPAGVDEAESPVWGSLIGCWTGLLYFSLLVFGIATVAEVQELIGGATATQPSLAMQARNALASTPFAGFLRDWTPLPDQQKRLLVQTGLFIANPAARKRLMDLPEIRALAAHPVFYQAWEDKKVRELLDNNDLSGLIDHPKVRTLLADEAFHKQAESLNLPAIFDRALAIHK